MLRIIRRVADHDLLDGVGPATIPGFQVDPSPERFGSFDRSGIGIMNAAVLV